MTVERVKDHRSEQEFTLAVGDHRAVAAYQLEGGTIVFTHTVVPPEIEGRGVGTKLIRGALDIVRDRGWKVVPQCPFVRAYIEKHPAMRDLLA
ncbi:GNAT family N-acetyltransferase [Sphingomonas sp. LR60]|uniref:GNAT family N-acetyltransferase n=1 Tax=Sphingomonas sp. LR60 TaxID=3050233 RepID=UPI002FDF1C62